MPSALNNIQFPQSYAPWYVYRATLVNNPRSFTKFDFLTPTAGKYNQATDDAVVATGFVIALEKYVTGMKTLQVATPGSLIPAVAGGAIQPGSQVKLNLDNGDIKVVAATATDKAAGKTVGIFRNLPGTKLLRSVVKDDIIHVLTGAQS